MSKHTPGEWKITQSLFGSIVFVDQPKYKSICSIFIDSTIHSDGPANARLIAAAPRMYELLAEARRIVRDMPPDWNYQWDTLAIAIKNLMDEIEGGSHEGA